LRDHANISPSPNHRRLPICTEFYTRKGTRRADKSFVQIQKDRGIRRLLLLTAFVPAILFIALGFIHLLAFAIPALFILVGCKMVRIPILNGFINRYVESENRATVISSVSLLERFVTFLLYPVVGLLADRSPDYALWLLGGVCLIFAAGTRISDSHLTRE
jgi:hypothetical protein